MTNNLFQPILLDVSSENKRGSCFRVNFYLFLLLFLISVVPVWGGETDFKAFRKAGQKEIKVQKKDTKSATKTKKTTTSKKTTSKKTKKVSKK